MLTQFVRIGVRQASLTARRQHEAGVEPGEVTVHCAPRFRGHREREHVIQQCAEVSVQRESGVAEGEADEQESLLSKLLRAERRFLHRRRAVRAADAGPHGSHGGVLRRRWVAGGLVGLGEGGESPLERAHL